jgi:hypothetical protein
VNQLHNYVLPIMQGYCQLSSFDAPTDQALAPVRGETANEEARNNIEYIIVSRRSKERAGLRYQRRGIDEDANVANFVETEVIMRVVVSGVNAIPPISFFMLIVSFYPRGKV